MHLRSHRKLFIWIIGIVLLAISYLVYEKKTAKGANATLADFSKEVAQKHLTTIQLRELLSSTNYSQLSLDDRQPTSWVVETPTRFGARNWVLYLNVNGTEIRGLKVRTMDSDKMRPEEAPADVVFATN